jgi:hypothetical protein
MGHGQRLRGCLPHFDLIVNFALVNFALFPSHSPALLSLLQSAHAALIARVAGGACGTPACKTLSVAGAWRAASRFT